MPLFVKQPCFCSNCGKAFEASFNGKNWLVCGTVCFKELEWKSVLYSMGESYRPKREKDSSVHVGDSVAVGLFGESWKTMTVVEVNSYGKHIIAVDGNGTYYQAVPTDVPEEHRCGAMYFRSPTYQRV